ncbi:NAD-dependent epimerase/dehydratase family protein [Streptomyces sp. NPDC055709]
MSDPQTIVITGAAGRVGSLLRERLAHPDRVLRLLDIAPPPVGTAAEVPEWRKVPLTELDALTDAFTGATAVVHLGGQSKEADFQNVLDNNVVGTHHVLEAARRTGISRVVLASSHHAAGFYRPADAPPGGLPADAPGRPDTFYGWSKVAAEALGRLYADRFAMDVLCLRIGGCGDRPGEPRSLVQWLSPDDCVRLVEACLNAPSPGYRIVWGISANSGGWLSQAEGETIGYQPGDDAADHAEQILRAHSDMDLTTHPSVTRLGGLWTGFPLGEPC